MGIIQSAHTLTKYDSQYCPVEVFNFDNLYF